MGEAHVGAARTACGKAAQHALLPTLHHAATPAQRSPTPLQLLPALTKRHGVGGGRGPEEQRLGDRLLGGVLDAQGLALHNGIAAAGDDGAGAAEQVGLQRGEESWGGTWMGEHTGRQGWHVQRSRVCAVV